jgi:hypothetical protein
VVARNCLAERRMDHTSLISAVIAAVLMKTFVAMASLSPDRRNVSGHLYLRIGHDGSCGARSNLSPQALA